MSNMTEYVVADGMPRSLFENKYSRRKPDGTFLTWSEHVATNVVPGNLSLPGRSDPTKAQRLKDLAVQGVIPFSGRHLQHGDLNQPSKTGERFTNCSTSMTSFQKFWLLMQGSGVGRLYDADICRVDWSFMPHARFVLSKAHPDYADWIESTDNARHRYDSESETTRWFTVEDSAEGWTKVVEILETAAFQRKHKDKLFIFDFSEVREKGRPIKGQQGRPASGPVPFIRSLMQVVSIRDAGMPPWRQAMHIDHHLSECILLGGIRRSARIACKSWREHDVMAFIDIKRGGYLWSANNSVVVDDEFWEQAASPAPSHARRVFDAMVSAAYFDGTGEPGFLNASKMDWVPLPKPEHYDVTAGHWQSRYHPRTKDMLRKLYEVASAKKQQFIVNPCVTGDTLIHTTEGHIPARELGRKFTAVLPEGNFDSTDLGFWSKGVKPVFLVKCADGSQIRATGNHQLFVNNEWVTVDTLAARLAADEDLQADCTVPDAETEPLDTEQYRSGYLVGSVLGDGGHNPDKYESYCRFWGDTGAAEANNIRDWLSLPSASGGTVSSKEITRIVTPFLAPEKDVQSLLLQQSSSFLRGFISGFVDADGSVQGSSNKGRSVRISQSNLRTLLITKMVLRQMGVQSTIYLRRQAGTSVLPDGKGGNAKYPTKPQWELVISRQSLGRVKSLLVLQNAKKEAQLLRVAQVNKRPWYKDKTTTQILSVEPAGEEEVFDCSIPGPNAYYGNGLRNHNCGEIVLSAAGGYCVISDICMAYAEQDEDLVEAAALTAEALIRVNTMPFMYEAEVDRTNRIGIGLTGIFEYAWRRFGYTFFDLLDEAKSQPFWDVIKRMRASAVSAAQVAAPYQMPHTMFTIKPSGTISKVMSVTEGAHLPAMPYYMRWVQFRKDDPTYLELREKGYPWKDVSSQYPDTHVIGYPTSMALAREMGDRLVTMHDVTLEQQYQWLRLLEEHWIGADGRGNQISYTMKYDPRTTSFEEYKAMILTHQPNVRACSMAPLVDLSAYSYVPEEPITREEYEAAMAKIEEIATHEKYDDNLLRCEGGACPIEFDVN
jgi:hypothetical protein